MNDRISGVVLAAGTASRFGGGKLSSRIGGKPILQHVLDALATAGLDDVVVVLGADAPALEAALTWRTERRVINPDPGRGLASSLQLGVEAIGAASDGVLIALGDQPSISSVVIRGLIEAADRGERSVIVPGYADDGGRNPVLIRRPAFGLVDEVHGDGGLGSVIAARPDLVQVVPVAGDNPDVDTSGDLARVAESMWAAQVRANRDQVERFREVPDDADFYAPVRSMFRADPTRSDDPVLAGLLDLVRSGDRWLDVGAGAGRYALPIARALDPSGGDVIALDPSPSMLEALREIAEDHVIENVRTVEARWPPPQGSRAAAIEADVALIAHVGYDVERIGPFLDALESAARRSCVAVLMESVPAAAANPFWPSVHGEARSSLPALPDFVDLLRARGSVPGIRMLEAEARRFEPRSALEGFVRRQLWIDPAGPKEGTFQAAVGELAVKGEGGWAIRGHENVTVGIVTWSPPH
jgi:CTP:molybdopterin cytidylyltransferase MocA/SAM-dependent methyltransferase